MNAFSSKSLSDIRKPAIQNRKLVGLIALAVAFTLCGAVAQAQQPKKVPRKGIYRGHDELLNPPVPRQFGWLCASVAT